MRAHPFAIFVLAVIIALPILLPLNGTSSTVALAPASDYALASAVPQGVSLMFVENVDQFPPSQSQSDSGTNDDNPFFVAISNGEMYAFPISDEPHQGYFIGIGSGAAVADFDNDGFCEVLAARNSDRLLRLYEGVDGTSFIEKVVSDDAYPSTLLALGDSAVGDFDNNHLPDFAFTGRRCSYSAEYCPPGGQGLVQLHLNRGHGHFERRSIDVNGVWDRRWESMKGLDDGDFNMDGSPDLAAQQYWVEADNVTHILLGSGDGTFVDSPSFTNPNLDGTPSLVSGDFNNDGYLDLIVGQDDGGDPGQTWLYLGNGTGAFTYSGPAYDTNPADESGDSEPGMGFSDAYDFDSDGNLDVVAVARGIGLLLFKGNGDGSFQTSITLNSGANWAQVATPSESQPQCRWESKPKLTLKLPWTSGVGWHFTGGPHPSLGSSVWDALDFMPCDEDCTVRAAADGVVARVNLSANQGDLYIDHEDGWTTFYGHLEAITVTEGMTVVAGQPVAIAGDRSPDPISVHLHFGLQHNGEWTPIGNGDMSLSGWRAYSGTISYTGYLERAGVQITAGGGCYQTDNIVSTYFAQDAGASYPLIVSPGENFQVTIRVANTGQSTWTEEDQVRLGLLTWNDTMGTDLRQSLNPGETVAPGEVRTWTISSTAPTEPDTYWQVWQMVREDGKIGWFGEKIRVELQVAVEAVESTVSPSGGSLTSQDGTITLVFPPGAVTDDVVVTCRSLLPMHTDHLVSVGPFFDLTAVYADSKEPAQLASGANYTMTITYTNSDPAIEDTLAVYYWDGLQWVRDPTSEVDVDIGIITAIPNHFSLWAVLGERRLFLPVVLKDY